MYASVHQYHENISCPTHQARVQEAQRCWRVSDKEFKSFYIEYCISIRFIGDFVILSPTNWKAIVNSYCLWILLLPRLPFKYLLTSPHKMSSTLPLYFWSPNVTFTTPRIHGMVYEPCTGEAKMLDLKIDDTIRDLGDIYNLFKAEE